MQNVNNILENEKAKATLVRKWCLISTSEAGSGHPTSCLSAADMMTVLFDKYFRYNIEDPKDYNNDHIVFSKGHAAPLLYTLFAIAGAYPLENLKTLRKTGSRFQGHPMPVFEYTEAATGSLGQGLSIGAGLAMIGNREKRQGKIFVLIGDGEMAEGQNWEAANFAAHYQLSNLIAIIDVNRLGQSGPTMFGHSRSAYADRFKSFGFEVISIDGHNLEECSIALEKAINNYSDKPTAIVMETIKGKGVSFLENKEGFHGKALDKEQLQQALSELGETDEHLVFNLKKPDKWMEYIDEKETTAPEPPMEIEMGKETGLRECFGETITAIGQENKSVYVLDGDVKNSTYTETFEKTFPARFVECFIAEQNMVSVAVGLAKLGKIPFVATFGAFLSRAADQIRMARVSSSNIKFIGTHVGVSIGEDGPSQMALEDIALFGAMPDTVILQPSDAQSLKKLIPLLLNKDGFGYMRILRPKTKVLYGMDTIFKIGGSTILQQSDNDVLTIVASGITVFTALKAAELLIAQNIAVCIVDCYSIHPIDKNSLTACLEHTTLPILITVEDHYAHGGMGDFVLAAFATYEKPIRIEKMAVRHISMSGKTEDLLEDGGIGPKSIAHKVVELVKKTR